MRMPSGNSASTRLLTRSNTSWIFNGATCGGRCGVSSRSISACRRSASLMITWVYSRSSGRSSSRSAQASQWIPDFVREVPDKLAVRLLLIHLPLLARDLELLVYGAKLDKQMGGSVLCRRDQAIQMQARLPRPGEGRVAAGVTPVAPEDVFEAGDELVGIGEQLRQRLVDYIFQAER